MTTDWQPTCTLEILKARAELNAQIRAFFLKRGVLEVETPILSQHANTDPYLQSVQAQLISSGGSSRAAFLHTSPEFAMKRLLASGSGPIYQICKTFRDGERGRRHNPEFTMLEWYRPGFDLADLMSEMSALLQELLSISPPSVLTYREAFLKFLAVDPFTLADDDLRDLTEQHCEYRGGQMNRDDYLNLLLSHCIEPELGKGRAVYLTEYPASQASLARIKHDAHGNRVALRFELYIDGLELANGYDELTDPTEQKHRFEAENEQRVAMNLPALPMDHLLLAALETGLPACSGVAMGLDRLLMIQQQTRHIDDVLAFPVDRA